MPAFKSMIEAYGTRLPTKCFVITILLIWALLHKRYNKIMGSDHVLNCPGLMLDPPLLNGLDAKSSRQRIIIIYWMPCRTGNEPSRFVHPFKLPWSTIGPHAVVYIEVNGPGNFHQWEILDFNDHGPSRSSVNWPLDKKIISIVMYFHRASESYV